MSLDEPTSDHPLCVLIGADTFPPDVNGAARFARDHAVRLARRGHDVHVVAPAINMRSRSGIDQGAVKREAHLDGKWLLRTSDPTLSVEDLAAAYKQLLAVERGWREMKGHLGLRPVFHHREDRIRAHVQLCWLALLLIRVVENTTGDTWRNIRHELDPMHLVTLKTPEGRVAQRTTLTPGQKTILNAPQARRAAPVPRLHHPGRLTLRRHGLRFPPGA